MDIKNRYPFLIVGGTGRTGRRVAGILAERGLRVRVTSRQGDHPFEWHDESTWDDVLAGTRRAFVAFHPDISIDGAADLLGRFAQRANALDVERIVLLSGRGEPAARVAEKRVSAALSDCTIIRSAFFMQDFSEHFLLESVQSGIITMPAGDTAEPFIDLDDLAAVAVRALTCDDLVGRTVELTGPELLTFGDVASILSAATESRIDYRSCSIDEFAAGATADGMPAREARILATVFAQVFDGRNAQVTDDVYRVLGRPPRRFAEFARAAAASGIWSLNHAPRHGAVR